MKIRFLGEIKKEKVMTMVQNCKTGQCECMSDETKAKIQEMQVEGEDGSVELALSGTISKAEIEAALAKSKAIG